MGFNEVKVALFGKPVTAQQVHEILATVAAKGGAAAGVAGAYFRRSAQDNEVWTYGLTERDVRRAAVRGEEGWSTFMDNVNGRMAEAPSMHPLPAHVGQPFIFVSNYLGNSIAWAVLWDTSIIEVVLRPRTGAFDWAHCVGIRHMKGDQLLHAEYLVGSPSMPVGGAGTAYHIEQGPKGCRSRVAGKRDEEALARIRHVPPAVWEELLQRENVGRQVLDERREDKVLTEMLGRPLPRVRREAQR